MVTVPSFEFFTTVRPGIIPEPGNRNPASIFFLSRILSNFRLRLVKLSQAPHDYLMREVTVTEAGYAYIFVSNENPEQVDVHFD